MRARLIAAAMSLALVACATTPEQMAEAEASRAAELADALEGLSPGMAQDCMPIDRTDGPRIIGDGVVLYRESGRRTWLARTDGACPWLRRDVVMITEVFGNQLCRSDRFRVVERGTSIPSGYCRFSGFTPYERD